MSWGVEQMTKIAIQNTDQDYAVFEAIGLQAGNSLEVLDVGCSDGLATYLKFAPYDAIVSVVGIDSACEDIESGGQRAHDERFTFLCATFEEYPEDRQFDIIYMGHVLQHLEDKVAALQKAYRLLKPGGFLIVKTTDDAVKISYPDPSNVMRRFFDMYERHVLPNTPWTSSTDRYLGQKCYTLFGEAGFENTRIATFVEDTAGKSLYERIALFERNASFRMNVPGCASQGVADEIHELAERWRSLFARDEYYFSLITFIAVGQKLGEGATPCEYQGVLVGARPVLDDFAANDENYGKFYLRPMTERDLGHIMRIELASFPSPWTPLAFAMELRYNKNACYKVLASKQDGIIGYVAVWTTEDNAQIVRIAVDKEYRRHGWGTYLMAAADDMARDAGLEDIILEVRGSNVEAMRFYESLGFVEVSRLKEFYTDPVEDAVFMCKKITEHQAGLS